MDRPIVFITIVFSIGIVAGKYLAFPYSLMCLILLMAPFFVKHRFTCFIAITCFLIGSFSFQIRNASSTTDILSDLSNSHTTIVGRVEDAPKNKGEKSSFPLKIKEIQKGKHIFRTGETVYASTGKDSDLQYGDLIKVRGRLTPLQGYANPEMLERGQIYFFNISFCEKLRGGGNPLKKAAIAFNQKFNAVLLKIMPQKEASLLGSILLGSSVSPLDEEQKDDYRKAGLIHLLVVSGTQVSILIGVCLNMTGVFALPLWARIAITSFFNLMLVVVTGGGASILRAAIMGEITLIGLLFERKNECYTSLALSALALLIIDPGNLFNIGFQLSFAATWALFYLVPTLSEALLPKLLAVSVGPILATAPLVAYYFNQITFGAVFSNLMVLPWVEFLVILGMSSVLIGFVFLPVAQILGNTVWLMLLGLDGIAQMVSSLPGACFYIRTPSSVMLLAYYLTLIIGIELLKKDKKILITPKRSVFLFMIILAVLAWDFSFPGKEELRITVLDVGQGDAILIESPAGQKILIDGGEEKAGKMAVIPYLRRAGINRLEMVILTHPHDDHVGGLNPVLEQIKVDTVMDTGAVFRSDAYARFLELIKINNIKYHLAREGGEIYFERDLKARVLHAGACGENLNNSSIVIKLSYCNFSILLTGDNEIEGEEKILERAPPGSIRSTVLKVGHHGSKTSTSDRFLSAVRPRAAIISCGLRNKFGHPHKATLQKLKEQGAELFRTDKNGGVAITSNGYGYRIDPVKP